MVRAACQVAAKRRRGAGGDHTRLTLFGYSITGAHFLFTSEKVAVTPNGHKATDLMLTADEKTRVAEYLKLVTRGTKRRAREEGYVFKINYFHKGQMAGTWSFAIGDVQKSKKPSLSLDELVNRVNSIEKQKAEPAGADQPATQPADKPPVKDQPSPPRPKDAPPGSWWQARNVPKDKCFFPR